MHGTSTLRPSGRFLVPSGFRPPLVVLAVIALLASCAGPAPVPPLPAPTLGPSTLPGSTQGPATTPSTSPSAEAWTRLDLPALAEVARLEPTRAGAAGVAVDTVFRLTSLDGRSPEVLATALVASPPVELDVASVDGTTAVVRPRAPLRPATTYRFSLARADGSTEATWAAVTAGPLEVTDSVPGDQATRVPRNTGIEVTFNQYGVTTADVKAHFTISPTVSGTFRAEGRSVAFAPATPLKAATLYTVTLRHGLPLAGTGQVLGQDVVIRFETRGSAGSRVTVGFRHPLADANPREQPAITLDVSREEDDGAPRTIPVTVHRLANLDAAIAAWRAVRDYPQWTIASGATAVELASLPRAWKGTARVRVEAGDTYWIRLPRLATGWYVVTETWDDVPRQVVLQVTDVSAFALAASDRTAVWVNDIATGGAIDGATVALDGARVGSTDARGLLTYDTPTSADAEGDERDAVLVIRDGGRAAVLPLRARRTCETCWMESGNAAWWRAVATDRVTYRSSDTINAWGMARNRDTGKVPGSVRVQLLTASSDDAAGPPIATATATPGSAGAFTGALAFRNLPTGSYRLLFTADGRALAETWLEVAAIVKPGYRLELATDRHAVIVGQSVRTTAQASFFEGTPVAGTALTVGEGDQAGKAVTTEATGTAVTRVVMRPDAEPAEQWTVDAVVARPTLPEEADIRSSTPVVVFRASAVVDVNAAVAGTRLTLTGTVSDVAFERYEGPLADPWAINPRGDGRPNAKVRLTIVEKTNIRRQTGTRYDFIRKIVVPSYDYTERSAALPARTVTTRPDGTFRLALTVRGGSNRWYEVRATYTDEAGRSTAGDGLSQASTLSGDVDGVRLERADGTVGTEEDEYSVGDSVRVRLVGGGGATASSRYLFAVNARGLAYVATGSSSTFRTSFDEDWLPGVAITGVRFNGSGYEAAVAAYRVRFRAADRNLTVSVTPDRGSYAPGATASLRIRVTNAAGAPVASTVMVRVIDEKLFATGAASESDVLAMLYEQVDNGIRTWGSTHRTPWDDFGWGSGDTTGGGNGGDVRSDFRDSLLTTAVDTGTDGTGTVRVPLSDDLTSWHVSAAAFTRRLEGGQATVLVPVALPFFVEATVAREYLSVDRPAIRVRGFGTGLTPADTVTFTISSDTLPLAAVTRTAKAYAVAEIPLPRLAVGTHRLRIEGSVGSGGSRRSDALIRTFDVVASRTTRQATAWTVLDDPLAVEAGSSLTTLVLADAGRGRVIPVLEELRRASGNRGDERLAAALADRTLRDAFGIDEAGDAADLPIQPYLESGEGVAILPYASASLDVTALAAMSGDTRLNAQRLREYLQQVVDNPKEWPRDRRLLALAGLAALGDPVLAEVRAAASQADLTVPEQISLALAAIYAGDEPLARTLERAVLAAHGERRGPWVRIDPGAPFDETLETARLSIVAASLGDPIAADLDAWLVENPSRLTSTDLERALAAARWARRVPASDAAATLTIGAAREVVTLRGGETRRIQLTPAQAAAARLERSSGTVLVVQTVDRPFTGDSLTAPRKMTLERLVTPSGTIGPTDTVVVRLRVTLGPDAGDECWRVTDVAPSGLAPIQPGSMLDGETGEHRWSTTSPDLVDGQRVQFCVSRNPKQPVQELRYVARVVTAGTYAWEPAMIQSTAIPGEGVVVPASTVTIAGIGS